MLHLGHLVRKEEHAAASFKLYSQAMATATGKQIHG
jgi:hypothetical protein